MLQEAHPRRRRGFTQEDRPEHRKYTVQKELAAGLSGRLVDTAKSKCWLRDSHFRGEAQRLGVAPHRRPSRFFLLWYAPVG